MSTPSWLTKVGKLAKVHMAMAIVLAVGVALRVLIDITYRSAFYFSDTEGYFVFAGKMQPSAIRPYGYSLLLNMWQWTGSIWPIVITQQILGLACGIALYAFILRKGGPRWLAVLAAAPIVLDAYALVLEHYLLADTLFIFLLLGGYLAVMWEDKLSVKFAIVGGLFFAAALVTRTVGLPLVALIGLYVLIRRVGWKPIFALAAAAGLPLIGYLMWFNHYNGQYSFSTWQDRWMYGRVMSIADCSELKLNAAERKLCQRADEPYAYEVDFYVWSHNSPINDKKTGVTRKDSYTFVGKVVSQQPGDFAKLVATETWAYFSPSFYIHHEEPKGTTCPMMWRFPAKISDPSCTPRPVQDSHLHENVPGPGGKLTGYSGAWPGEIPEGWFSKKATFLNKYGGVGVTPGPLLFLGLLLIAALPFVKPRKGGAWRLRGDALLLGFSAFALLVGAIATSQFDIRYGAPILVLIPPGAALAYLALRNIFAAPPTNDPQQPVAPARKTTEKLSA